jgi:hypothetical protein
MDCKPQEKKLKVQIGNWKTGSESKPYQIDFRPSGYNSKRYKKAS